MMEPHMIENYIHYVFVFEFNHVGFIVSLLFRKIYKIIISSGNIQKQPKGTPYMQ